MSNEKPTDSEITERRRRNRVNELAAHVASRLEEFGGIMVEVVSDLGVMPDVFTSLVTENIPAEIKATIKATFAAHFSGEDVETIKARMLAKTPPDPYAALIDRLLKEAPAMDGASNQTAAVDLQIRLRSGKEMIGALAYAPEGSIEAPIYRFLVMGKHESRVIAVEHYFSIADIEYVAVLKAEAQAPAQTIIMG